MSLYKRNGKYFTPGGCSAWNGRCFSEARYDAHCQIGYINFTNKYWYKATEMPFFVMDSWLTNNENPGCTWNHKNGAAFRALWSRISDGELFFALHDVVWLPTTMQWTNTHIRTPDMWFKPCIPYNADSEK